MTAPTTAPVSRDAELEAYRVTGFAEATSVLRGTQYSSDPRRNPLASPALREMSPGSLLFLDPPEHTRLRRRLSPAFTPRAIEALRPRVTAIVDAVLDGLFDVGPEIDVLADVGYPVPLAVIAELLDVGIEGAELFAERTPDLVRSLEFRPGREDLIAVAAASADVVMFLTPILARRRRQAGDDFISALLADVDEPDGLSLDEVATTCVLLLAAGHETTTNLITTGTLELLRHPREIPRLLADPDRAVEELLRFAGPVKIVVRTAVADHDLGGERISAGQPVIVDIRAANRDARRFADAARLDLGRAASGQLAFGGGAHFCLGAALARLEASVTLHRLFSRYPGLELPGAPLRWRDSTAVHALTELSVRLS
jgi:cytochrome P450